MPLVEIALWLIPIIIVHELGHIIPLWIRFKRFPPIKITKWGLISPGNQKMYGELTVNEKAWVAWAGVWAGLLPLLWYTGDQAPLLLFAYSIMCMLDVSIIIDRFTLLKQHKNNQCKDVLIVDGTKYDIIRKKPTYEGELI